MARLRFASVVGGLLTGAVVGFQVADNADFWARYVGLSHEANELTAPRDNIARALKAIQNRRRRLPGPNPVRSILL